MNIKKPRMPWSWASIENNVDAEVVLPKGKPAIDWRTSLPILRVGDSMKPGGQIIATSTADDDGASGGIQTGIGGVSIISPAMGATGVNPNTVIRASAFNGIDEFGEYLVHEATRWTLSYMSDMSLPFLSTDWVSGSRLEVLDLFDYGILPTDNAKVYVTVEYRAVTGDIATSPTSTFNTISTTSHQPLGDVPEFTLLDIRREGLESKVTADSIYFANDNAAAQEALSTLSETLRDDSTGSGVISLNQINTLSLINANRTVNDNLTLLTYISRTDQLITVDGVDMPNSYWRVDYTKLETGAMPRYDLVTSRGSISGHTDFEGYVKFEKGLPTDDYDFEVGVALYGTTDQFEEFVEDGDIKVTVTSPGNAPTLTLEGVVGTITNVKWMVGTSTVDILSVDGAGQVLNLASHNIAFKTNFFARVDYTVEVNGVEEVKSVPNTQVVVDSGSHHLIVGNNKLDILLGGPLYYHTAGSSKAVWITNLKNTNENGTVNVANELGSSVISSYNNQSNASIRADVSNSLGSSEKMAIWIGFKIVTVEFYIKRTTTLPNGSTRETITDESNWLSYSFGPAKAGLSYPFYIYPIAYDGVNYTPSPGVDNWGDWEGQGGGQIARLSTSLHETVLINV